jgi:hypothetical protein
MQAFPWVRCYAFTLLVVLALIAPVTSTAQVAIGVTVGFAPPDLPVYEQPICPGPDYLWTPGYWAWDPDFGDYYWVPGTWVLAPEPGFFWTPGYWAWGGGGFLFHEGYWGPVVGFYGGVVYGFGYFGHGYQGGRWEGGHFFYNRTVNNVNVTVIHNVYNTTVINERNVTRVSYNGGNGGINERATAEEERAAHERHIGAVADQQRHMQQARSNPELRASQNRGKPPVAATPRPAAFNEHGVVHAREGGAIHGGPGNTGAGNNAGRPNAVHPRDIPRPERPGPPNTGNAKQDRRYQQQQEKLYSQQQRDRDKLQRQQDKEDQRLARRNADEGARHQTEQRHQQQTQQMEQRHTQQQQRMEEKQPHGGPPKERH